MYAAVERLVGWQSVQCILQSSAFTPTLVGTRASTLVQRTAKSSTNATAAAAAASAAVAAAVEVEWITVTARQRARERERVLAPLADAGSLSVCSVQAQMRLRCGLVDQPTDGQTDRRRTSRTPAAATARRRRRFSLTTRRDGDCDTTVQPHDAALTE